MRRLALIAFSFATLLHAQSDIWYQKDFPPEEFKARWQRIFAAIGKDAVAILPGMSTGRGFTLPRQTNEFFYLSGVETPGAYLLLDGHSGKVTLLLPRRNARLEAAEGKVLSAEDATMVRSLVGVDDVRGVDTMNGEWLGATPPATIYTPYSPAEGNTEQRIELVASNAAIASDFWDGRLSREAHFIGLLHARYPKAQIADLTPIIDEMRSVKSEREIALIRRSSQIAGLGMMEAIKSTKPGLYEYNLDAACRYVYLMKGARLEGYRSITAAGTTNIWNGHYYRNNSELKSGDMVLMDFAPEYHYYTSDIGRMWPVNGKYADWQRELLGFVLAYRNAVLSKLKPGATNKEILDAARQEMEPIYQNTRFSKPVYQKAARVLLDTGGGVLSHPVGLTVHDDGPYNKGPLKVGHVFSIDPQLRVPEENLYIRYEDTVVITPNGYENFTEFLPAKLEDLEALVGKGGVVQRAPLNDVKR